ncbi:MAG TPA: heavy metal-associated domain-containing protein [Planctomycetota bacterium]|nr:heavy metal-associated domain-containing protein [Planctomycetota bacterium]
MADGLRRLDGVADVEVDLQQNLCAITPARDRVPALDGVPAAVVQAGYRAGRMWLRARGEVHEGVFRLAGSQVQWPIEGSAPAGLLEARIEFRPGVVLVPAAPPAFGR